MMNNEKEILDLISKKFDEEAQNTSVPESLGKDNVVEMLKASSGKVVNLSAKSEIARYTKTINALKRVIAVAAALMVVLITALLLNTRSNISVFSKGNNSGTEGLNLEKIAEYIDREVKKTVSGTKTEGTTKKASVFDRTKTSETSKPDPTTVVAEQQVPASLVSGKSDVSAKVNFVRTDGRYIYRYITVTEDGSSKSYIDIISLATLNRVSEKTILPGGRCFDIIVQNNTLAALSRDEGGVTVRYYDITDRTAPVKSREFTQEGAFVYAQAAGGKLCVITGTAGADATYSVNGDEVSVDSQAEAEAKNYSFITVTDIDNLNSDLVTGIVPGKCADSLFTETGVYLTSAQKDAATGENVTALSRYTLDGDSLRQSASYDLKGSIAGSINVSADGEVTAVTDGLGYSVYLLSGNLELIASATEIYDGKVTDIYYTDDYICVSGSSGAKIIKYAGEGKFTFTEPEGGTAFADARGVFTAGGVTVAEGKSDSEGKAVWSMINAKGEMINFALNSRTITSDPRAQAVSDKSGSKVGVPVRINGKSGYLFFSLDSAGKLTAYPRPYVTGGGSDSISFISGDKFYTVSDGRVTAVSVDEITA